MRATGYAITALGSRKENQDSHLVDNDRGLFAVADGIGGGERGDVASLMAVTGVGAHPVDEPGARLVETVHTIQEAVLKEALESLGEARMGTTLTAIRIVGGEGELVHVGDSRCYRLTDGHLMQLTTDHEAYDEAYGAPVLASYLGIPTDLFPFQVQEETIQLSPGDRLLLCSDGLYKQVSENVLVDTIRKHAGNPQEMLKDLVAQAAAVEHSDNITIVFIEIEE